MGRRFRITFNAPVTLTFIMICAAATFLGEMTGGRMTDMFFMTYFSSWKDPLMYVRWFTHILGHGDWNHFLNNAFYLVLLGPALEEKHGGKNLAGVMVLVALSTALVNLLLFRNIGICGASGVVFAFILLTSFTGFHRGEIPLSFILVAVIYLGQQVIQSVGSTGQISYMAHIVGGIVGAIVGYRLNERSS